MINRLPAIVAEGPKLGSGALALSYAPSSSPDKLVVSAAALHDEGPTCPAFPAGPLGSMPHPQSKPISTSSEYS